MDKFLIKKPSAAVSQSSLKIDVTNTDKNKIKPQNSVIKRSVEDDEDVITKIAKTSKNALNLKSSDNSGHTDTTDSMDIGLLIQQLEKILDSVWNKKPVNFYIMLL
ncbi:uncharacterized protein LOC112601870 [Melanaphis sacchari]|uniref:uncharacterized protein LOC112601870 n=1 Tax=Melanaphis sacchari TaxID=742174 RepID=UPI000DC13887|nr:uncharacterized protein LOC112601870 [Melanaphis sacchari]